MIWIRVIAAFVVGGFWASCVLGAKEDKHSGMK